MDSSPIAGFVMYSRAEIKASGKVCWGAVLSKFQDPQSHGNGQTIPIKSNHKYFPVKQYTEDATSDELWNLLHRHVTSAYGSFKHAFLEIDEVCDLFYYFMTVDKNNLFSSVAFMKKKIKISSFCLM